MRTVVSWRGLRGPACEPARRASDLRPQASKLAAELRTETNVKAPSRTASLLGLCTLALALLGAAELQAAEAHRSVPFRGQLERNGAAVNGTLDMVFKFYTTPSAGSPIANSDVNLQDVPVYGGTFVVALPLSDAVLDASEAYIEVSVDGVPLAGRQRLYAAPYAMRGRSDGKFKADNIEVRGSDLVLGTHDGRSVGNRTGQRALVHYTDSDDQLVVNFGGDFEGGTKVDSNLEVDGDLSTLGSASLGGDTSIGGNTSIGGDATITGATTIGGLTTVNNQLTVDSIELRGSDLVLGTDDGRSVGSLAEQRALVHHTDDKLIVNFGNDFEGGTKIDSPLEVDGDLRVNGNFLDFAISGEYYRSQSNSEGRSDLEMTSRTRSICFLTEVQIAETDTNGETARCKVYASGDSWKLEAVLGDTSDADVWCRARCLSW